MDLADTIGLNNSVDINSERHLDGRQAGGSRKRSRSRSRSRDRRGGGGSGISNDKLTRVFVANIPYDMKWQTLKDLFREKVGEVDFVEVYHDPQSEKPNGRGIVEFKEPGLVKKALDVLHRYDLNGRFLVVKEDYGVKRDREGNPLKHGDKGGRRDRDGRDRRDGRNSGRGGNHDKNWGNTYGLSPEFLDSLGIDGPLVCKIFVANLDFKADVKKLREVFKLAGRIIDVELNVDLDGKSRGHCVVEYEHPVEAVQAISMFHDQPLFERRMVVRMDRFDEESNVRDRLPIGLRSVGMGLGANGQPLQNVAVTLAAGGSLGNKGMTAVTQAAPIAPAAMPANLGLSNLVAASGLLSNSVAQFEALRSLASLGGLGGIVGASAGGSVQSSNMGSSVMQQPQSLLGQPKLGAGTNGAGSGAYYADEYRTQAASTLGFNPMKVSDTVIVRNLPTYYNWQTLESKFKDVGQIRYAEMTDRGTGTIRFVNEKDARRAVSLFNETREEGQYLDVTLQ